MVVVFNQRLSLVTLLQFALEGLALLFVYLTILSFYEAGAPAWQPDDVAAALIFSLCLVIAITLFGLYRQNRASLSSTTALRLVMAAGIGALGAYAVMAALGSAIIHQAVVPAACLLGVAGVAGLRALVLKRVPMHLFTHRVLVLGTSQDALSVGNTLLATPGVELVGFYSIGGSKEIAVARREILPANTSLKSNIRALAVDEVIVAVREQRGGTLPLSELLSCRLQGVRVTDLSGFFERVTGQVPIDSLKASWLIYGEGFRQGWRRRLVKRMFDISVASMLLVLASPLMLVIALAIYLESGGPVIFRQLRIGLGGRTFMLRKFRSMRHDAEHDGMPRWAKDGDPRITRVGAVIRRLRLDELPQLCNVLIGDMSFVGPRPERPFFVNQLTKQIPFYGARHTVKPGVSGWAQVNYTYGASVEDAVKKLQYDLYYVKNHTLLLDLIVLVKTVRVVLSGWGAR